MALKEDLVIVEQQEIAKGIFSLILEGDMVKSMSCGQFVHIRVPDQSMVLRRPLSISQIDTAARQCRLIYRVEGRGTDYFSKMTVGQTLDVLGPLGKGFPTDFLEKGRAVLLVGGGIGVPPLVQVAKEAAQKGCRVLSVIGFAHKDAVILEEELSAYGDVLVTTDDGSYGQEGTVAKVIDNLKEDFQAIYSCGAAGMLVYLDKTFQDHPHAYLSLEGRMACGTGACYACVVKPKQGKNHENVRVCKEGPVFETGSLSL
ncbi:TPA: dihydroorotate dehydrogenase electron transfer subunit [Streptococcus suis]